MLIMGMITSIIHELMIHGMQHCASDGNQPKFHAILELMTQEKKNTRKRKTVEL